VFTRTGNLARRVASRLLARDAVFAQAQRAFVGSLEARRAVDRNIGRILAALNLPSHQELERLYDDVRALEQDVSELTRRAERLTER